MRSYVGSKRKLQLVLASVLSKEWQRRLSSRPILNFAKKPEIRMKRNKFIQEFNLTFAYSDDDYESCFPRLDQWLHVAAKVM